MADRQLSARARAVIFQLDLKFTASSRAGYITAHAHGEFTYACPTPCFFDLADR